MKRYALAAAIFLVQPLFSAEPYITCEKKFGEMKWQGVVLHRYALRAENFPPDKKYHMIYRTFNGAQTKTYTYQANKRGHLIFQKPENVEGDILAVCPAKKGERLTFMMQAEDGSEVYKTYIIPFPIEVKTKRSS
jgi:hypothetical protein